VGKVQLDTTNKFGVDMGGSKINKNLDLTIFFASLTTKTGVGSYSSTPAFRGLGPLFGPFFVLGFSFRAPLRL
jgi:hypothetical protein